MPLLPKPIPVIQTVTLVPLSSSSASSTTTVVSNWQSKQPTFQLVDHTAGTVVELFLTKSVLFGDILIRIDSIMIFDAVL